jgi:hypothetical protein
MSNTIDICLTATPHEPVAFPSNRAEARPFFLLHRIGKPKHTGVHVFFGTKKLTKYIYISYQ